MSTRQWLAGWFAALSLTAATPPKNAPPRAAAFSIPMWTGSNTETEHADSDALAASDLLAFVNGKPAAISKILAPDSDLIIVTVLDLVGDLALVQPAKESLIAEIGKLPGNVWIGLLHAQEGLSVLSDPTADRESVSQMIQSLPISGKAGLLDTLVPVTMLADGMLRQADVRVAVLYVTDSDITNYREDLTNPVVNSSDPHDLSRRFPDSLIRERAARLGRQLDHTTAPLFILHLQYRQTGLNQSYQSALSTLAENTAGYASFCRSSGAIPQEIANMIGYIRSSYFLKFAMPQRLTPAIQLRLERKNADKDQPRLAYRARILVKQR